MARNKLISAGAVGLCMGLAASPCCWPRSALTASLLAGSVPRPHGRMLWQLLAGGHYSPCRVCCWQINWSAQPQRQHRALGVEPDEGYVWSIMLRCQPGWVHCVSVTGQWRLSVCFQVPHLARFTEQAIKLAILPVNTAGATLMLLAGLTRTLRPSRNLPAGAVLALIGSPYCRLVRRDENCAGFHHPYGEQAALSSIWVIGAWRAALGNDWRAGHEHYYHIGRCRLPRLLLALFVSPRRGGR